MKEIIIHVEDSAYEKFMGMLSLCPQVEVVSEGVAIETREAIDLCVARAIREMRADGAFRFPSDYTYLMIAANEGQAKGMSFFHSPKEYLDYLKELELTQRGFEKEKYRQTVFECIFQGQKNAFGRYFGQSLKCRTMFRTIIFQLLWHKKYHLNFASSISSKGG